MSLHYHLVQRMVPAGDEAGKRKYFGQVRSMNLIDFDTLCSQVAVLSTANKGEVALVLNGMVQCLTDFLKEGHIVQMGDLGNFRPSAGSEGADSEESFHLNMMRRARVLFTPGRILRELVGKVGFRFLDLKVEQHVKPCDKVHLDE